MIRIMTVGRNNAMKKHFYTFAFTVAALAAVSCSEKLVGEAEISPEQRKVPMTFSTELPGTKTSLQPDGNVFWSDGDMISIFDGTANEQFSLQSLDGSSAIFAGEAVPAETYYALYPYSEASSFNGNEIVFDLPSGQDAVSGSFASGLNPSAAAAQEGVLNFRNVAGLVKVTLNSVPAGSVLKSITFSGRSGEPLAGKVALRMDDFTSSVSGSTSVTISSENIAAGTYYFVVHPAVLSDGIELVFTYGSGTAVKRGSVPLEIIAGEIRDLGSFDAPEPVVEDGSAENPYRLRTADDLMAMKVRLEQEDYSQKPEVWFSLEKDVDMSGKDWEPLYAPAEGLPWDNYPVIRFEGNNHVISNLSVSGKRHASFLGVLIGSCKNLVLENASVETDGTTPAGTVASVLASYDRADKALIENVTVSGTVKGAYGYAVDGNWDAPAYGAGGIAGVVRQGSKILTGNSTVKVDGTVVGGIAGAGEAGGEIIGCTYDGELYAHGDAYDVYAGGIAGSIAGENSGNRFWIKECHASGKFDAKDMGHSAGGIAGRARNDSWIETSWSDAEVVARLNVGGIAGNISDSGVTVQNCVSWCTRYYTEPYVCDIQDGIGHIAGYVSGAYLHIGTCWSDQTVALELKSPSDGSIGTVTVSEEDKSGIDTEESNVTRIRYCGTAAASLEEALAAAGIAAE